jgi:RNA recognition motif-containing protein
MVTYANSKRRRNIARIAAIVAFTLTLYAGWTFYNALKESKYDIEYKTFIESEIKSNPNLWLQRDKIDKDKKIITLNFNGDISDATKSDLLNELNQFEEIKSFELIINGNSNRSTDKILELYDIALDKIEALNYTVDSLNLALDDTQNSKFNSNFINVAKDVKIQFPDLQSFGYSKFLQSSDFRAVDTIYVAKVKWGSMITDSLKLEKNKVLKTWLIEDSGFKNIEIFSN